MQSINRTALAMEALLRLLAAKLCLRLRPVRKVLLDSQQPPRRSRLSEKARRKTISDVRWAVLAASRHAPVELVCFPQCLAALGMLRSRGIATRLHYGVARMEGRLETHTWLEVDGLIIIGGEVSDSFSPVASYSSSG